MKIKQCFNRWIKWLCAGYDAGEEKETEKLDTVKETKIMSG
jgi:hypothetical protein